MIQYDVENPVCKLREKGVAYILPGFRNWPKVINDSSETSPAFLHSPGNPNFCYCFEKTSSKQFKQQWLFSFPNGNVNLSNPTWYD